MTSAVNLLLSKIRTDRELTKISSANIMQADVDGYTRKDATVVTISNQSVSSVTLSPIQRSIDKLLQSEVRFENSKLGKQEILNDYYQKISQFFGTKGSQSFVHDLGDFISSLNAVAANPGTTTKHEVIQSATSFCIQLNTMADQIQSLRTHADQDLASAVQEVNNQIENIRDYNLQIGHFIRGKMDATKLEDERDLAVHKINELMSIRVSEGAEKSMSLATEGGMLLTAGNSTYALSYDPSLSILPGQILGDIMYASQGGVGVPITSQMNQGKIAGLLELRDKILPHFQAELDELSRVLRDTVNVVHNEGAALGGPSILTGTIKLPGIVDASNVSITPVPGATVISGQGTLRLAVTNSTGTILDYKDIPLTDGMTIDSLITAITNQTYAISGNGTASNNGDLTVQQLPTGELQVFSVSGNSISIGSISGAEALVSATNTFDGATAKGFSHFFGLNNFFETGSQIMSNTVQVGLSNTLKVKQTLTDNNNYMSIGKLNGEAVIPLMTGLAIESGQAILSTKIADVLGRSQLTFLAAGQQISSQVNINEYASRVMSYVVKDIQQAKSDYEFHKGAYDLLASRAQKKSGVDASDELLKLFDISTSMQLSSKALSIVQNMERDLMQQLSR